MGSIGDTALLEKVTTFVILLYTTSKNSKYICMSRLMISVAGIRGIVGETLTPEIAAMYARTFSAFLPEGTIVIGRDSRTSGPMLQEAVCAELIAAGRKVYDIGIVPTPTVEIMVKHLQAVGGIIISASHNPAEWNALKLLNAQGLFLSAEEGKRFHALAKEETEHSSPGGGEVVQQEGALDVHIQDILAISYLPVEAIKQKGFRVALDAVHGAGGAIGKTLLAQLGCTADILYEEPTGAFPHNPEPTPEHLTALQEQMQRGSYNVGFAFDPDVDRLALLDENGTPLGEEMTLALAARFVLAHRPGAVVTNLSTSAMIEAVAADYKVPLFRTPVGEANVVGRMLAEKASIGGEGHGGVILPEVHAGRDAPLGVALILALMTETGKPLSQLAQELPQLEMIKERTPAPEGFAIAPFLDALTTAFAGYTRNTEDGVRFSKDGEWIHIRPSGTEPIIRYIAEASEKKRAQMLIAEAHRVIGA